MPSERNRALDLEAFGDKQGALKSLDIAIKLDPTDKFVIKERQSLAIGDRNNYMRWFLDLNYL